MGDWDDDDWEVSELPAVGGAKKEEDKFADEDQEEEEEKHAVEAPKPKSEKTKQKQKFREEKVEVVDETLDDPLAEKLRQQRLVEEADLRAAQEAFGGGGGGRSKLDTMIPKTEAEMSEYADLLFGKYLRSLERSPNYRHLLKELLKKATDHMETSGVKEIESAVVVIRNAKMKEDKDKSAKTKKGGKKFVNAGGGGGDGGGLDDAKYFNTALDDDGFDFM